MKAKPSSHAGEVLLELNRRDEALMQAAAAPRSAFQLKKILVPMDFSDCAKKALQYAIPLAKEHQAAITLLHVSMPPSYTGAEFARYDYGLGVELRSAAEKELAKLVAEEVRDEVVTNTLVRSGSPTTEILDVAGELPADLIVISTHGYTGLKHVFLGSIAEHVVQRAPCPVLVVREQEHEFVSANSQKTGDARL